MKYIRFFLFALMFFLVFSDSLTAQIFGVSLGTGVFDGEDNLYINGRIQSIPKNLNVHVQSVIHQNIKLNFSAGYGYSKNYLERYYPSNSALINYKTTIRGFPIEGEILIFNNMINVIGIEPFIGLGIGYYHYDEKIKYTMDSVTTTVDSGVDGFAQYFTLGLNLYINKKVSTFIQFKKLGLSRLKQEVSIPAGPFGNPAKYKADVVSKSGTQDLGISLGFLFYL